MTRPDITDPIERALVLAVDMAPINEPEILIACERGLEAYRAALPATVALPPLPEGWQIERLFDQPTAAFIVLGPIGGCVIAEAEKDARTIPGEMLFHLCAALIDRAAIEAASRGPSDGEALRLFAQDVMQAWPLGDVDGGDLQEAAVRHGLLAPKIMHAPCGDNIDTYCSCVSDAGYDDKDFAKGVECFRKTPMLLSRDAAQGADRG